MLAVLALAAVLLMLKLDVETADRVVQPFGASELMAHVDAVVVGHLDVAAGHLDVGVGSVGRGGVGAELGRVHGLG
jgi:hypothetical protein